MRGQKSKATITSVLHPLAVALLLGIGVYGTVVLVTLPFLDQLPYILTVMGSNFPFSERFPSPYALQYYATALFDSIISILVAVYVFHIALNFRTHRINRHQRERTNATLIPRWSLNVRIQHAGLFATFTLCAVTGFALTYFDSWGAAVTYYLGGLEARRLIHLGAGFLMGGFVIYHSIYYGYVFLIKKKRPISMMPTKEDIYNFFQDVKYNLGLAKEDPKFGRFGYVQKFLYWGVYWGILILGAPGVLLWYFGTPYGYGIGTPNPWMLVAWIFHEREAMLAVVTLFMLHFYSVHFTGNNFPMKMLWITGKISEEDMIREHPLEYEENRRELAVRVTKEKDGLK